MRHKVCIKISLLLAFMLLGMGYECECAERRRYPQGRVTDEYGKPLPGVVVNSENGRNGTTTGIDGKYVLTVNDGSDTIVSLPRSPRCHQEDRR
ncbi:MAG: hypothetical protein ACLT1W_15595 [Alistipes onderdonkii]